MEQWSKNETDFNHIPILESQIKSNPDEEAFGMLILMRGFFWDFDV